MGVKSQLVLVLLCAVIVSYTFVVPATIAPMPSPVVLTTKVLGDSVGHTYKPPNTGDPQKDEAITQDYG